MAVRRPTLRSLISGRTAPFAYAQSVTTADIDEANSIGHSLRVLQLCIELSGLLPEAHKLNHEDKLVLTYAALFHDLAKSKSDDVSKEIASVMKSECRLYENSKTDHGVRSAYYLRHKMSSGAVHLPGLSDRSRSRLLTVIAYHSSTIYDGVLGEVPPDFTTIRLSVIFRLADIADSERLRAQAASTVSKLVSSGKTRARSSVTKVTVSKSGLVWKVAGDTADVRTALAMANEELEPMSTLLQAMCLPYCIRARCGRDWIEEPVPRRSLPSTETTVGQGDQIVLRAKTFPELYEKIVRVMCPLSVESVAASQNYCGPILLVVEDAANDRLEKTVLRNDVGWKYEDVVECTSKWLSDSAKAHQDFYFGYTHGQRIYGYLYPKDGAEMPREKQKFDLGGWSGRVNQFASCADMLMDEGPEARRAYWN